MPYLPGSPIVQADTSVLQDASGNDIVESDWDFNALTSVLNGQQEEVLTRIGPPQSDLFSYAHDTAAAVVPIAGIVETIASLLGIVQTLQAILGTDTVGNDSMFHYLLEVWNQVGLQGTPWPVIGQQADDNATAILNAIADLSEQVGGGGGSEAPANALYLSFDQAMCFYAPDSFGGPTGALRITPGAIAGLTIQEFLDSQTSEGYFVGTGWGWYHHPNGDGSSWVFRYNDADWAAMGGASSSGGGSSNQDVLDAIDALRGGTATVQNAYDDVEGARSDISDLSGAVGVIATDISDLRGGEATVQGVQDTLDALEIAEPPTAAEIATAVWAEVLSGQSASARLVTASEIELDLSPVTNAIALLRGGDATVQQVLTAVQGLSFPDVPTENEVAAAVWTYLISGVASGTLLNTAATRAFPNVPPVWPGAANVSLGTPVAFTDTFHVHGTMHGCIIAITSPPVRTGQFNIGGELFHYGMGRIAFGDDSGHLEGWVYTGFEEAVYLPRQLKVAASVHVQVVGGAQGTLTPFTITP